MNGADETASGLVRARGLKLVAYNITGTCSVRARKSPWIETSAMSTPWISGRVRARKSPWIETPNDIFKKLDPASGLVRARGLKLIVYVHNLGHERQGS